MNKKLKFHSPDGPAFNVGEQWLRCDGMGGSCIIVETKRYGTRKWDVDVVYQYNDGQQFSKDAWNFQVRYYHIADKNI